MIRKIKKTAIALLVTITVTSCSDFLDKPPVSDLYVGTFWKSDKDANVALMGMYFSFAHAMSNGFYDWGEIRGGNWQPHLHNGENQRQLITHEIPNTNTACRWSSLYQAINRANLCIKYIPNITMEIGLKNSFLAEAYAMRALCYFYAVRTWGDVPVFIDPVEDWNSKVVFPRRTRSEAVLDMIQADLTMAERLIPATPIANPTTSAAKERQYRTRISSASVVYAIMMDVYAWRHQYDMVIRVYEDKLSRLNSGDTGWGLEPKLTPELTQADFTSTYRYMFDKNKFSDSDNLPLSREVIFSIFYGEGETGINQSRSYFANSSQRVDLTDNYVNAREPGDKRFAADFQTSTSGGTSAKYQLRKYWVDGVQSSTISDNYLMMYRYADMVLLYAEALCMTDKLNDSVEQLNTIRQRSGIATLSADNYETSAELLDVILKERRMELICEGKYWFDLVRTGNAQRLGGCPPDKILFPIYRDHILQNPNLGLDPL